MVNLIVYAEAAREVHDRRRTVHGKLTRDGRRGLDEQRSPMGENALEQRFHGVPSWPELFASTAKAIEFSAQEQSGTRCQRAGVQ